jgi:hypothetical protein
MMQTFLPFSNFAKSAAVLDGKRLWKQRVETMQILRTLSGISDGWKNHPAVRMWRGHEGVLLEYQRAVIAEGIKRGYKDNVCWDKSVAAYTQLSEKTDARPSWLGNEALHASHRSNLLRKDADWYSQFGWGDADDLEYIWPV